LKNGLCRDDQATSASLWARTSSHLLLDRPQAIDKKKKIPSRSLVLLKSDAMTRWKRRRKLLEKTKFGDGNGAIRVGGCRIKHDRIVTTKGQVFFVLAPDALKGRRSRTGLQGAGPRI